VGFDALIVGGGHNGLVCAAYLARGGVKVLVIEARGQPGGCAATLEALSGARVNVSSGDHIFIRSTPIVEELGLASHGLRYVELDPVELSLGWDGGPPAVQFRDPERTLAALQALQPRDVDGYRRFLRAALPAAELVLEMAIRGPRATLRRLTPRRARGLATLLAWSRRSAQSVLDAYFSSPILTGAAATIGPALWGQSPRGSGTGLGVLARAMRHVAGIARPIGGSGRLCEALTSVITAHAGSVRCDATVAELLVTGRGACGVRLENGEVIEAPVVVCAIDPRRARIARKGPPSTAVASLSRRWTDDRGDAGFQSKIDAVVSEPPSYRSLEPRLADRLELPDPLIPTATVSLTVPAMAHAHAAMQRGEVSERPPILANVPSVADPTLLVSGNASALHVLSLEVLWTPYALRGGWRDSREPQRWLEAYAKIVHPGFLEGVVRWQVTTPPDYEAAFGLPRGHVASFDGTPLSMLLERSGELSGYQTTIRGLYVTGASTFPGAGIWGASGRNAARAILH
jgi:phytoene dehydrogenase-like protein